MRKGDGTGPDPFGACAGLALRDRLKSPKVPTVRTGNPL